MLEHGGRLRAAATHYRIALADWLDLSTGINPRGYPPPPVDPRCWLRLPEENDGLESAAASYYGCTDILPVAGSQAAIQALPAALGASGGKHNVGILTPGYAEHAHAWRHCNPIPLEAAGIEDSIGSLDILLLVNPNNPTGHTWPLEQLLDWHQRLSARGGWLIVDEAFVDVTPGFSLARHAGGHGLVVLRSLGKFFGLAGARVGFVLAAQSVRDTVREMLGPWALSGPARVVARQALLDSTWQTETRARLYEDGLRLAHLLTGCGLGASTGCALFRYLEHRDAAAIHAALAQQGVLVRLFKHPSALRFGLPGNEAEWHKLEEALLRVTGKAPKVST